MEIPTAASTPQRVQTLCYCVLHVRYHAGQSRCNSSLPRLHSLGTRLLKIKVIIFKNSEYVFKNHRMGKGMGCSVVASFLCGGVTEPLAFSPIVQGSVAGTTSFSHQIHV